MRFTEGTILYAATANTPSDTVRADISVPLARPTIIMTTTPRMSENSAMRPAAVRTSMALRRQSVRFRRPSRNRSDTYRSALLISMSE